MKMRRAITFIGFFLLSLGCVFPCRATADEVVVVLGSDAPPYQQALAGVKDAYGPNVKVVSLSQGDPDIPKGTRVIVAIGGKAALHAYSPSLFLIYCLAPGTQVNPEGHPGGLLAIYTSPSVYLTLSKFKELQPSLKRIAIIWAGDSIQEYVDQKKDILERLGIEIVSDRIQNPGDLPGHLRALKGKVDALWLAPDAAIVTPKNFATLKEFSLANGIPFYVPSEGLVEQGATASVTASFADIGVLAGKMAREALKGPLQRDRIFPENLHVAVSLSHAKNSNLNIPPEILKQVEKVFP